MSKRQITAILVLTVMWLWVGIADADIMIQKNESGAKEITYYKGKQIAIFSEGTNQIVDAGSKTITGIDSASKTYYQATLHEYKTAMLDVMKHAKDMQIQMMMASTGQTREQAEASLKTAGGDGKEARNVKIEKGETKDIAGYTSDQYRILENGAVVQEIWVSQTVDRMIANAIGASEKAELDAVIHEIEEEINGIINMSGRDAEIAKAESEIMKKGYVMKQIDREMGMPVMPESSFSVEISTQNVDPSKFAVPKGYKKISMSQFLQNTLMSDMEESE